MRLFAFAVIAALLVAPAGAHSHYYVNSNHRLVHGPDYHWRHATARCADGTFSHSRHASGTCSHHGGVM